MQHKHFKRLLPLPAVALLILAFLVIELEEPPGSCERKYERRQQMATSQSEHLDYREAARRTDEVRPKYEDLFWRQPNVWGVSSGFFLDDDGDVLEIPDGKGGCSKVLGIKVWVTEKVDQNTLPPEDRIPDVIEGVPVQIIEDPYGIEFFNPTEDHSTTD